MKKHGYTRSRYQGEAYLPITDTSRQLTAEEITLLFPAAKLGDEKATTRIIEAYYQAIENFVRFQHPRYSEADIQDVMQDAMEIFIRYLKKYDPSKHKCAWYHYITNNLKSRFRAKRYARGDAMHHSNYLEDMTNSAGHGSFAGNFQSDLDTLPELGQEDSGIGQFEDDDDQKFTKTFLEERLSRLSDRNRHVVAMRFGIDGYDQPATLHVCADFFGINCSRVQQIVKHSLKKMRQDL